MSTSIPALHVSSSSKVSGSGEVFIQSRQSGGNAGIFKISVTAQFLPPADAYPTGNIRISVDLFDSAKGTFISDNIELINSHGKYNPTVFLTGRCKDDIQPDAVGCRYWLMIANNKKANEQGTPDVVSFTIHDNAGNRIAYGTGPLRSGDFDVDPR